MSELGHNHEISSVEQMVPENDEYKRIKPENGTTFKDSQKYWDNFFNSGVKSLKENNTTDTTESSTESTEQSESNEGLTDEQKKRIKEETGRSDEIINNIQNMKQYEILKNAGLKEVEINGRKCLIKTDIDLDYTDADGISNRDRINRGHPPLDSKTGKPIELHHLGQKADSPLVELTAEEHRTGEYENGKKNQSLWHDNTIDTDVHGKGNKWDQERKDHWTERAKQLKE